MALNTHTIGTQAKLRRTIFVLLAATTAFNAARFTNILAVGVCATALAGAVLADLAGATVLVGLATSDTSVGFGVAERCGGLAVRVLGTHHALDAEVVLFEAVWFVLAGAATSTANALITLGDLGIAAVFVIAAGHTASFCTEGLGVGVAVSIATTGDALPGLAEGLGCFAVLVGGAFEVVFAEIADVAGALRGESLERAAQDPLLVLAHTALIIFELGETGTHTTAIFDVAIAFVLIADHTFPALIAGICVLWVFFATSIAGRQPQ